MASFQDSDCLPKVILLNARDGVHFANFCPGTDQLHPYVSSDLDDRVLVIGKLGRCSIWIKLDIRRDKLVWLSAPKLGLEGYIPHMCRDEDRKWAGGSKEANLVDGSDDRIDLS